MPASQSRARRPPDVLVGVRRSPDAQPERLRPRAATWRLNRMTEHHDTVVVSDGGGTGMGMVLGIIAIIVLLVAAWLFFLNPAGPRPAADPTTTAGTRQPRPSRPRRRLRPLPTEQRWPGASRRAADPSPSTCQTPGGVAWEPNRSSSSPISSRGRAGRLPGGARQAAPTPRRRARRSADQRAGRSSGHSRRRAAVARRGFRLRRLAGLSRRACRSRRPWRTPLSSCHLVSCGSCPCQGAIARLQNPFCSPFPI